jgi:hypothetical protein
LRARPVAREQRPEARAWKSPEGTIVHWRSSKARLVLVVAGLCIAVSEPNRSYAASLQTAALSPTAPPVRAFVNQYCVTYRDLLDLDVDVTSRLPPDDAAFGFDNIADVLGVPPVPLERHVDTAAEISERAVGSPDIASESETYRARQDLSQDRDIEGLPIGTVGGLLVRHTFPLDAEYVLQAKQ